MALNNFVDYSRFRSYVQSVIDSNDLSRFKQAPDFSGICEHLNCKWGIEFYNLIKKEFPLSDDEIQAFCTLNDRVGGPQIQSYPFGTGASNSVKYVYHANLALRHLQSRGVSSTGVVEIGGGYGGMALAMNFFAPKYGISITSYKLIDLPELIKLQELYLKAATGDLSKYQFHSAFNHGSDITETNQFLVSIYALGELTNEDKQKYINNLILPKTSHGFLIWNAPPYYSLFKSETMTDEVPLTGPHNKFIFY